MRVVFVTGTDTEVGKTIATAALAVTARDVHVFKAAQTGVVPAEPGDADVVRRLAGVPCSEGLRLREPLAPATAARVEGVPAPDLARTSEQVLALEAGTVLVEGAGGVLVRLGADWTLLDLADRVAEQAPVSFVVVARSGLGTLNHTELTVGAIRDRGHHVDGVVIGSLSPEPDLATRENLTDLPAVTGVPLLGSLPAGAGGLDPAEFRAAAPGWLAAESS